MKVAVDARELSSRPTGVGRYLAELLREWREGGTAGHELVLYTHRPPPAGVDPGFPLRVVPGNGGTRWEQWALARALAQDRPDVFFAPGYTAPLACPAPIVLAIHDVSYFAHPEWYTAREGLRRRQVTAWAARRARVILAPSAFSAAEIVRYVGVPERRVRVVHLGVRTGGPAAAGPRRPDVLYVGSLFQRRRIDVLIDAFARVAAADPEAHLDIVGENRTVPRIDFGAHVAGRGLGGRVSVRHWVDDEALEALYASATAFAFLSSYEGFGFTPLEALARGAVPVVLDTPVAREIYGDAAWRLSDGPGLADELARALLTLLGDAAARQPFLVAAPAVLGRYHWCDTAARTWAALEEAGGA